MLYRWIDITAPLTQNIPVYRGDAPFKFRWIKRVGTRHRSNLSLLTLGSHTGTHIDAPLHFLNGGLSVDQLSLDVLSGPCRVVEAISTDEIGIKDLGSLDGCKRILFRTRNTHRRLLYQKHFVKDFVALSLDAAKFLVGHSIQLVGIDYLSIEKFGHEKPEVHWALLKAGVVVVEGLDLTNVSPGNYELFCLPLRVTGAEGAPCRAVLRQFLP